MLLTFLIYLVIILILSVLLTGLLLILKVRSDDVRIIVEVADEQEYLYILEVTDGQEHLYAEKIFGGHKIEGSK